MRVSLIAQTVASTEAELPHVIKDEFDAFLEFGIRAHGYLRLRCGECGHDKLLAFSCKRRGICLPCGARCMSHDAAIRWTALGSRPTKATAAPSR